MEYGLLGERLPYSFSKEIHAKLGSYEYNIAEVPQEEFDGFIKQRCFKGLNVTIPYKQQIIPYLDSISERAREIGAVNTVINRNGKLYGDNTDFGGLTALIKKAGIEICGKKVLILGTGGTSRTAYAAAKSLGAAEIYRVSRSGRDGALSYEEAYGLHADADVLINTTPCGTSPNTDCMPCELSRFDKLSGVVDVIYNPLKTKLVLEAHERGIKATGGLYMLAAQAALASELFTGSALPDTVTDRIYGELLFEKQNIVLTGMPSSGKSTVGRILAERLGREFVDTDAEIIKKVGIPITEIFVRYGEEHFRDIESDVIAEVSKTGRQIIATGGGAILRKRNVLSLKMNGRIFFLDRPPEHILPTDDRPLANDSAKIADVYGQRYHIYTETADVRIPILGTPDNAADIILR